MIERDLIRTHGHRDLFGKGQKYHQALKNVLLAYLAYKPDFGYVQGLNYIAANLIFTL